MVVVQRNVLVPAERLETVEFGLAGEFTVELPAIMLHAPDPVEGLFPARVAEVEQRV